MTHKRTTRTEATLLAVAIVSILVVIAMLILIALGSGNWFTVAGSSLTTIGAVVALAKSRRARRHSPH
jgi:CHASE2 domain-containing sensor protein